MKILCPNSQRCWDGHWHTVRQRGQAAAVSYFSSSSSPNPGDPRQHRAASIALGVIYSGGGKMFFSPVFLYSLL